MSQNNSGLNPIEKILSVPEMEPEEIESLSIDEVRKELYEMDVDTGNLKSSVKGILHETLNQIEQSERNQSPRRRGRKRLPIVMGLDIGTTKICALIGEVQSDERINVIGVGMHPARGLKKGVVVNIDSTVDSIRWAVDEAQLMAGRKAHSAYVGIAGGHITGINSTGIIAVKNREITLREINQAIDAARAVALPMDREVIHVLPQAFIVNNQEEVVDPLGMFAVRLEAKVHLVTVAVTSAHNIIKCVNNAGLEVEDIVLEQLASGASTLTPEERERGTVIIDIGGGTTDIALLVGESVKHTAVLAVGGSHITNDLAFGLGITLPEAEQVKKAFGSAYSPFANPYDMVEVRSVDERPGQKFTCLDLCDIIEPRVEEILQMAQREILHCEYADRMTAGIVLTGGTALLHGIVDLAEKIFGGVVRIGTPRDIGGLIGMVNSPIDIIRNSGVLRFTLRYCIVMLF